MNCIEHKNKPEKNGYVKARHLGIKWYVHRLAYFLNKGIIGAGLEIDHLCKNKQCINPDHLEMVTPTENKRRSSCPSGLNFKKTECLCGHKLSGDNLYVSADGERKCRQCKRLRDRRYRAGERG